MRIKRFPPDALNSLRVAAQSRGMLRVNKGAILRLVREIEYMREANCMCDHYGKRHCIGHSAWIPEGDEQP